jgi:hypothetical protein
MVTARGQRLARKKVVPREGYGVLNLHMNGSTQICLLSSGIITTAQRMQNLTELMQSLSPRSGIWGFREEVFVSR